jgi:nucleotide-binding universal stress UspA family protein
MSADPNREEREDAIRRILVALDFSPHSLAALDAAADLASRLDAEIVGLYVEDIRLLKLADLPLAREIGLFSPGPRAFDRSSVELQLRAQGRAARKAMERQAERKGIRWSFRVVQGSIPNEVLAASSESDLAILGKVGWSRRRQLGSTARLIVAQGSRPVIFLQSGVRLILPVGVVYDGSAQSWRALGAAASLLRAENGFLTVFILAGTVAEAQAYQAGIARWLRERKLRARYRWLIKPTAHGLKDMFHSESCGLLVLPQDLALFPGESLIEFLRSMECAVMLAR